jgi:hypothetical protein
MTMMVRNRKTGVRGFIYGMNDGSYRGLPLRLIRLDCVIIAARKGMQRQMNTPAAITDKDSGGKKSVRKRKPSYNLFSFVIP